MQFPYFSSDKGGRPLQSLLGDPQDVLRKKSEQSCTFALRTREVFNREACMAVPRLCWCPRGSSWSVWLCLPSRRPWFFSARAVADWEFTRFMDQISCDEGKMEAQKNWKPLKSRSVWSLKFNGDVLWSEVRREKVSHSWLAHLRVTELKLCECFLSSRQETLSFVRLCCLCPLVPLCLLQMFSHCINRFLKRKDLHKFSKFLQLYNRWIFSERWYGSTEVPWRGCCTFMRDWNYVCWDCNSLE